MARVAVINSCSQGVIMRIDSSDVPRQMSPSGVFFSKDASVCTSFPCTLSAQTKETFACNPRAIFELEITADSNGDGLSIWGPGAFLKVTVVTAEQDVYIVRAKDLTIADTKVDAYSSQSRVAAQSDDILYSGDVIVAEGGKKFVLEYNGDFNNSSLFFAMSPYQSLEEPY